MSSPYPTKTRLAHNSKEHPLFLLHPADPTPQSVSLAQQPKLHPDEKVAGPCSSFHFIAGKIYPRVSKCALQIKKAQEKGSNKLPRSPVPQKWDVLLNSKISTQHIFYVNFKTLFRNNKPYLSKTSETKTQDSSVDKVLPLSQCETTEQVSEKIGLHQLSCILYKINLGNKMKMFQFDQDFLIPI